MLAVVDVGHGPTILRSLELRRVERRDLIRFAVRPRGSPDVHRLFDRASHHGLGPEIRGRLIEALGRRIELRGIGCRRRNDHAAAQALAARHAFRHLQTGTFLRSEVFGVVATGIAGGATRQRGNRHARQDQQAKRSARDGHRRITGRNRRRGRIVASHRAVVPRCRRYLGVIAAPRSQHLDLVELPQVHWRAAAHEHARPGIDKRACEPLAVPLGRTDVDIPVGATLVAVQLPVLARQRAKVQYALAQASEVPQAGSRRARRQVLKDVVANNEVEGPGRLESGRRPLDPAVLVAEVLADFETGVPGLGKVPQQLVAHQAQPAPHVENRTHLQLAVVGERRDQVGSPDHLLAGHNPSFRVEVEATEEGFAELLGRGGLFGHGASIS